MQLPRMKPKQHKPNEPSTSTHIRAELICVFLMGLKQSCHCVVRSPYGSFIAYAMCCRTIGKRAGDLQGVWLQGVFGQPAYHKGTATTRQPRLGCALAHQFLGSRPHGLLPAWDEPPKTGPTLCFSLQFWHPLKSLPMAILVCFW